MGGDDMDQHCHAIRFKRLAAVHNVRCPDEFLRLMQAQLPSGYRGVSVEESRRNNSDDAINHNRQVYKVDVDKGMPGKSALQGGKRYCTDWAF